MSPRRRGPDAAARERQGARPRDPWWATHFDAHYLREYEPLFQLERDRREVARLLDLLALPQGSRVLDLPCGQGRHAHLLAEAGFVVDGLDYSEHLLRQARERGTGATLRYTRGDMRKLPARWNRRFDAVVNLFTSFGFFDDPADDRRVVTEIARVLKPGGVLVWNGGSRDGIMARFLARDWWRTGDGTLIAHERRFDPLSGWLEVKATWRGLHPSDSGEREHRIRLYTASALAELFRDAGLIVEEAWSGWSSRPLTRRASEMTLIARKT